MPKKTMTTMPALDASRKDGVQFAPDDSALSRWAPGIHAASSDEDERTISIYDVIGDDFWGDGVSSKRINGALRQIGNQDVIVNINSPGGDFFEGVAIYNMLREHPGSVEVRVMALAASAASVVAMAGDTIRIAETGFLMIHNSWAIALGDRRTMLETAEMLESFDGAMAGLYASRAGIEADAATEWMDAETWFNGAQAIEANLADAYLPSSEIEDKSDSEPQAKSILAVRRVEAALMRQGLPRSERRSLIGDLRDGKPSAAAADDATRDAGAVAAGLTRLIETMRPGSA